VGSNPTFPTKRTPDFIGRFLISLRGAVRGLSESPRGRINGVVLEDGRALLGDVFKKKDSTST
jgi:hypothetical protein